MAGERERAAKARAIWDAAVAAAEPRDLVRRAVTGALADELRSAGRILVAGGGKAGAAMAAGLEEALAGQLERVEGLVNVPQGGERPLRKVVLIPARPAGSNFPTAEGVAGAERMLGLLEGAGPADVAVCLLSGGGSALLPAPAEGITLADKQATTRLLHACGATIAQMNAVRKHLSRIKGGGLARAFGGRRLVSLMISDVIGDPLDVIASGPTAPDPTTFADALEVLNHFELFSKVPAAVRMHLEAGAGGRIPESLKVSLPNVEHRIVGSISHSLRAAQVAAEARGYQVLNLGGFIEGEARIVAEVVAGLVRSIRRDGVPISPPCCVLFGGETTVTLGPDPGKGGRNQEFVLALSLRLGRDGMAGVTVLSGGTDGEDGPTDAAGAIADSTTIDECRRLGMNSGAFLERHDAYTLFDQVGQLLRSGLTGTNVMDAAVVLID